MRALAITGMETAPTMPSIMSGSLIRATPPCARMSAGTRSRAITATAPASSAILAWSAVTTSMITPPLSISAIPRFTRAVPRCPVVDAVVDGADCCGVGCSDTAGPLGRGVERPDGTSQTPAGGPSEWTNTGGRGHTGVRVGDLEVTRQRRSAGQVQPADQPPGAQAEGVAHGVVVHPP